MNNLTATVQERRTEALTDFLNLLRVELEEDFQERPDVVNCTTEVVGVLESESFDVKMAVWKKDPSAFRREVFDLLMKGSRCFIEHQVKTMALQ